MRKSGWYQDFQMSAETVSQRDGREALEVADELRRWGFELLTP